MSYFDYRANVFKNNTRRRDKEDVEVFPELINSTLAIHHGIMGDGDIRVICHKQGLPTILEVNDGKISEVEYADDTIDFFDYGNIYFIYKGYQFGFHSGSPYEASMTEPDGTFWECFYDYGYGVNN